MSDQETYKKAKRIKKELELVIEVQKTKEDFIKEKITLREEANKYKDLNMSIKIANKFCKDMQIGNTK